MPPAEPPAAVDRSPFGERLLPPAVALAALLLGLGYVQVVPPGEAPDEPAHLAYVEHLRVHAMLPRFDPTMPKTTYEAHQPPLGYAWLAAAADVLGVDRVEGPFVENPNLDFDRPGSRAFLEVDAASAGAASLRAVRRLQLLWALLAVFAGAAALRLAAPGDAARQVAALGGALLAPQLLFTGATVNNDAAAIGLASAALAGFVALAIDNRGRHGIAAAAGVLAAAAAWAKLSALFLFFPLSVLAFALWREARDGKLAFSLTAPWVTGVAALALWNRERFGAFWLDLSRYSGSEPRATLLGLLTDWTLPLSLWRSYWAKFGWFNLPLPVIAYLAFLPTTLLVALGVVRAVQHWKKSGLRTLESRIAAIATSALAGNLLLLLAFTLLTAWRPQGRLLFPSIGAVALLAALGHAELERRLPRLATKRWRRALALSNLALLLLVNFFSILWIERVYATESLG